MKTMTRILISAIGLLLPRLATAQGTLYVSNLEQPPTGGLPIGSDFWIAQDIRTGTNAAGYALDSVQLLMNAPVGNPTGFTVAIYSSTPSATFPGGSLGSLTGLVPTTAGIYTYNASDLILLPHTVYFVVASSGTAVGQGAFNWSTADSFGRITVGPGDPWGIGDGYFSSPDGSTWTDHPRQDFLQLAISGAAIPEPATLGFFSIGTLILGWRLWRHKQRP